METQMNQENSNTNFDRTPKIFNKNIPKNLKNGTSVLIEKNENEKNIPSKGNEKIEINKETQNFLMSPR